MAETKEVIIEIEVDNSQAQKTLERTTTQLRGLSNERKELNKQIKQSDSQLRAEGTTRKEVNKRIVENGLATKRLSEEKRKATKEVNLENNSLNALRNNLSKLTAQRNNVNTGTKEGAKQFAELNKQIAAQNKEISSLEQAGGDFRRNVGNYGSAIDNVIPGFSALTTGIASATKAALAFIATPLGAVIAALGLALGAVIQYFTRTQEGIEKLRVVTAVLSTSFEFLLDIVAKLGGSIVSAFEDPQESIKNLGSLFTDFVLKRVEALLDGIGLLGKAISQAFSGDFEEALETAGEGVTKLVVEANPLVSILVEVGEAGSEAFEDIATEATKAALAAGELESQLIAIEKQENNLILQRAQANRQIAELRVLAEQRSRSEEERIDALQRAAKIEQDIVNTEIRLAQQRANIIIEQNKLTESTEEDRKRELEALAQVEQLQQRSFNLQKSLTSRLEGIKREAAAAQAKRDAEEQARLDAIEERENRRIEKIEEATQKEIDAELKLREFRLQQNEFELQALVDLETDKRDRLLENEQLTASERLLIQEQYTANVNELEKQQTDFAAAEQRRKVQDTQQALSAISSTLGNLAVFNKDFAVAQAIVDGIAGVQRTIASVPYPFNIPLGVTQGAIAIKNVNDIRNQKTPKFAKGGMVDGPSHANGGVKFAVGGRVNELEGGEAVINKRSTKMFAPLLSSLNQAGGGVKFANGGITGFNTADAINADALGQEQLAANLANLPSPVVSVTEITDTQNTVTVTEDTASL